MAKVKAQIIGLPKYLAVLAKLDVTIQEHVHDVMVQSASAISRDASSRVRVRLGDLRRAIGYKIDKKSVSVGIMKDHVPSRGHFGKSTAHEYPHIYGVWLEKGRSHQGAQPFMAPAVEAEKARFPGRLRDVAVPAIERSLNGMSTGGGSGSLA